MDFDGVTCEILATRSCSQQREHGSRGLWALLTTPFKQLSTVALDRSQLTYTARFNHIRTNDIASE